MLIRSKPNEHMLSSLIRRAASTQCVDAATKLPYFVVTKQDIDQDDKYAKAQKANRRKLLTIVSIVLLVFTILRSIFPLSHEQIKYVDESVRSLWTHAEQRGIIEKFPDYELDYYQQFPHLSLLEENYETIRQEVESLLETTSQHLPRLKDLYRGRDGDRAKGKVYKTDWKTFWLKMGSFIPPNCARTPKTAELLESIPDLYNAFFSVLEPHQHIDAHWGHYKGFLRYHLGLIVPGNNTNQDSFLRIRTDIEKDTQLKLAEREVLLQKGTTYYWHEGEGVMFDDNPLHDATNNSDGVRVVLFLDLARPLPWYMDLFNRITLFIGNHQDPINTMRRHAVVDETVELTKG